jgi:hypothetical protein
MASRQRILGEAASSPHNCGSAPKAPNASCRANAKRKRAQAGMQASSASKVGVVAAASARADAAG